MSGSSSARRNTLHFQRHCCAERSETCARQLCPECQEGRYQR
ncbi:hypothetical protein ACFPM0_24815 [Pseudonocardia sulfidoxydans]